ncbi:MAG: M12 family metallo-peptidase [Planctomycetota bacterium]
MSCNRGLVSCLMWAVSIPALWLAAAAPAAGAGLPLLQAAPDPPTADGLPEVPNAIRSRFVRIDAALLAPGADRQLELNLFENASFAVALEAADGADTWRGVVEGDPPGTFTMVRRGDRYAASIRVPGHMTYRIRPLENGLHLVQEVDETVLAPCGNDVEHAVGAPGGAGPGGAVASGDTQVIDVLVVYTENVRYAAGGQEAIEAEIDLFVAETNGAYANSLVNTQLNLVYAGEVDYDDVQNSDHLNLLTDPEDGELDEVHGLRYNHVADMVALLVTDAPYCGVAWLMWNNSPDMDRLMFSITRWNCGGLVFAHELGHNMGCCHAPGDGGGCGSGGLYPYSVGYRFNGDGGTLWRTVMAYSPGVRIPNFSNPDVSYDGEPTGVPVGQPDEAENALTINQTSPTIAAFRSTLPYCEVTKHLASDGATVDSLGLSMATDAGAVVVGAPYDDDNGQYSGSAYVFAYDADLQDWIEQDKLTPADGAPSGLFGSAVALEGGVAVIGAPGAGDNGPESGAAYVFRYDPGLGQWVQEAELLPADGSAGDYFGHAVAVSGDVAVVAAPLDDDEGPESGSVYVFGFDPGSGQWTEQEKILASDGAADNGFGGAVAAEGDVVIVGAPAWETEGLPGAAYCFGHDGGASAWIEQAKIQPSDSSPGDDFGTAIALDGDLIIVGASGASGEATDTGAAYVYRHDGSAWSQEAKIVAADGAVDDAFGEAVAIGGDLAIVGAPFERDHGLYGGAAYAFRFDGGGAGWTQAAKLITPDGVRFDLAGSSVGLHGKTALVGVAGDNEMGTSAGALYGFRGYSGIDCNSNGTDDVCEIIAGDLNGNDVPDECDIPGDLDGDGAVGVTDFLLLLAAWGPCADCGACPADLDGDCDVAISDFLILLANWTA